MSPGFNERSRPPPGAHRKAIVKRIEELGYRHDRWQVLTDFAEAAALSISNAVDWAQRPAREERYMKIVERYRPDELAKFPQMLGELTLALEEGFDDVLGGVFHALELHNKFIGQYFTPYDLCRAMARMVVGSRAEIENRLDARGYISACEPAVGTGAMVIALAECLRDEGVNYQQALHVTAVDVDAKCAHMAYLQLALLHVPAIVVHGNALTREEFSRWYTPAHIMGGWDRKLRGAISGLEAIATLPASPPAASVTPASSDQPPVKPSQLTLF